LETDKTKDKEKNTSEIKFLDWFEANILFLTETQRDPACPQLQSLNSRSRT
jgi:hypothetical protein